MLYVNPRGSSSYGEEFGNLIHHAYPGFDYDDLISGVDAVLAEGYADEDNLFVTGGSGGGVLTAWIVGKTDRFRAAVSAKPVINWYSFALTADMYNFFYNQALNLMKVDTMLVRIPGASHGIARRPSQLMAKVAHILAWFEKNRTGRD